MRAIALEPAPELTPTERLRVAGELHELGRAIKRQALRRADPGASEAEIDARLFAWLAEPR